MLYYILNTLFALRGRIIPEKILIFKQNIRNSVCKLLPSVFSNGWQPLSEHSERSGWQKKFQAN